MSRYLVLLHRNTNGETSSAECLSNTCSDFSVVHFYNLFAEIESHTKSRRFTTECGVFFKQAFCVDSLKTFPVVLDRNMKKSVYLLSFHHDHGFLFV